MFQKKTVIVVGAGASAEAKLPTGKGLTEKIAFHLGFGDRGAVSLLTESAGGDQAIRYALQEAAHSTDSYEESLQALGNAAERIRQAMPQAASIDSFIDAHRGNESIETVGKLAIAAAILSAEHESSLYLSSDGHRATMLSRTRDTWFAYLMRLIAEDCRAEEVGERLSSLCFVVFNYDRCVEHFLFHAIRNYYGLDVESVRKLVSRLEIYHPYGHVGRLPWSDRGPSIEFGCRPNHQQLSECARELRTFTEGTDPDSSDIETIRTRISEAGILLFLGFAFHRQNLQLLALTEEQRRAHPVFCYATAKGISETDREVIMGELLDILQLNRRRTHVRTELTCAKLFSEYWRTLSLS